MSQTHRSYDNEICAVSAFSWYQKLSTHTSSMVCPRWAETSNSHIH